MVNESVPGSVSSPSTCVVRFFFFFGAGAVGAFVPDEDAGLASGWEAAESFALRTLNSKSQDDYQSFVRRSKEFPTYPRNQRYICF
jgi:hypothetical protein